LTFTAYAAKQTAERKQGRVELPCITDNNSYQLAILADKRTSTCSTVYRATWL